MQVIAFKFRIERRQSSAYDVHTQVYIQYIHVTLYSEKRMKNGSARHEEEREERIKFLARAKNLPSYHLSHALRMTITKRGALAPEKESVGNSEKMRKRNEEEREREAGKLERHK